MNRDTAANTRAQSDDDVLVRVEGVGKKFCRDLKKSLWYGMQDIVAERLPGQRDLERHATLRRLSLLSVSRNRHELGLIF